jgi:hypothetical protein
MAKNEHTGPFRSSETSKRGTPTGRLSRVRVGMRLLGVAGVQVKRSEGQRRKGGIGQNKTLCCEVNSRGPDDNRDDER